MNYLIFCSFEVGGFPYFMADVMNKNDIKTYYISIDLKKNGHDSTIFHFGESIKPWDLSYLFKNHINFYNDNYIIKQLRLIKDKYKINKCFATGRKSYLLSKAGMDYFYWSYGSDLDQQCFKFIVPFNYPLWKKSIHYLHFLLKTRFEARSSLLNARKLMIAPYQINKLKKLKMDKKELFFLPHIVNNIEDFESILAKKQEAKRIICNRIKAPRFFFSSTRHIWNGYLKYESDNKGNDIAILSFKKYLEISSDYDSKLILIEKGQDVEDSKTLIKEKGLDKNIIWVKELKRRDLDIWYLGSEICLGQFATPVLAYSAIEPLAKATPCISYYYEDNNDRIPFYAELPPVFNSKNTEEIAYFMANILKDEHYYNDLSYKSWLWIKNNCSEINFINSFVNLYN